MKRFKVQQACLALMMLILSVLIAGCGSNGQTGHWLPGFPESSNPDITRPRVTAVVPADGVQDVPINVKTVAAAFNEAMDPTTLTVTSFTLWCDTAVGNTTQIQITGGGPVTYLAAGNVAMLPLPSGTNLPADVDCTATITSAATDVAGNQLAGNQAPPLPDASNFVWIFHTSDSEDTTDPSVINVYPDVETENICVNTTISAQFNEPMDPATIISAMPGAVLTFMVHDDTASANVPGIVTYDIGTDIATFTPSSNLIATHDYTASISIDATDLSGNPLTASEEWSFTVGSTFCQLPVTLGSAGTFGIMATAAITNTGNSIINGDVSLEPGTSMTGFPPGVVNGNIHINDSVSHQARADLLVAYNSLKGLAPGTTISAGADLGALYPSGIPPGTYTGGSTMLVSTPLILDAGGNANAVWVFQIGSSLTTTASVSLANGAQAKNVFWVPTSDATIGVGTIFYGTIVSGRDVNAITGAVINGRILAGAITDGTIALQGNIVNVPAP